MMGGYLHPDYARSFSEFGTPRELPSCGGWVLEREIPGTPDRDTMGCYPLFCCQDWSRLASDVREMQGELVSLALVTDPFGDLDTEELGACFDRVIPFKNHLVARLDRPLESFVVRDHQRSVRNALRVIDVEHYDRPLDFLDEWLRVYSVLIQRHRIQGIRAFSRESFAKQFQTPGFELFRAVHQGETVGMLCLCTQGPYAYEHLAAATEDGYRLGAMYAMTWSALRYYQERGDIAWMDFGSVAGIGDSHGSGLRHWKQGWATDMRMAYFCMCVLDADRYEAICHQKGIGETSYFPAYRVGEFA